MPSRLTTVTMREGERKIALRVMQEGLRYRRTAAETKALTRVTERVKDAKPDFLIRFAVSRSCLQNFLIPAIAIASARAPEGVTDQKARRIRAAIEEARVKIGGAEWGKLPVEERNPEECK